MPESGYLQESEFVEAGCMGTVFGSGLAREEAEQKDLTTKAAQVNAAAETPDLPAGSP
ncbi:hypothetical protein SAMN05216198_2519 [Halopseudomonas litoralis]|uniref:Uncharacterized protein n=1 Tax=Halopseudomonas litoralis TaxID=797277 RepID=A0A1H1U7X9_9GAMM|nr:hypothetical protein SAMN05216198_2519 [Halopseudomonas litoralis]